jgi:hypothetical protein
MVNDRLGRRAKSLQNEKKIILIITEDTKSSCFYMEEFKSHYKIHGVNLKLKILSSKGNTNIEGLMELAKSENKNLDIDETYIITDCENVNCDIFQMKNHENKNKKYNFTISVPCFEFFVYLHNNPKSTKPFNNCDELVRTLEKSFKYSKSNRDFFKVLVTQFDKIKNHQSVKYTNPSTEIPELLNKLLEYKAKKLI